MNTDEVRETLTSTSRGPFSDEAARRLEKVGPDALQSHRARPLLIFARHLRDLETTIYRVVQESLTNVVKHADASRVDVSVTTDDTAVVVEVHDDGKGFDTAESTAGFGVAGMRERVFLLGGTLTITSDEAGTYVKARIPLPTPTTASDAQQALSQ